MVVEYVRYQIAADRAEVFEAAYRTAAERLRASANCLAFELARCAEAPDQYVLRIEWDSVDGHLEGFRKGPQFPPFLAAIRPFMEDILEMRHYQATDVRWAR